MSKEMTSSTLLIQFVNKMKNFFGDKGLIFNALANEYYDVNSVTREEISVFYELFVNPKINLKIQNKKCYISSAAFFKSCIPKAGNSKKIFVDKIEKTIDDKDQITEENLTLAYNIIEFEDKFNIANKDKLQEYFQYLQKFADLEKNLEYYVIFNYYSALLYLKQGNFKKSQSLYFETIAAIDEYAKNKKDTPFFKYLKLKNDLLFLRITKQSNPTDKKEYLDLARETYQSMKTQDVDLALKLGIEIFNIYESEHKLIKCEEMIKDLSGLLVSSSFENQLKNGLMFYILIAIRMAYISCMQCDSKNYVRSMKKLFKSTKILDLTVKENVNLKLILDFIILIYRLNINSNALLKMQVKDLVNKIKNDVIIGKAFSYKIFNDANEVYVNIYAINSEDSDASIFVNTFIKEYSADLSKVVKNSNKALSYIFGLYNLMSNYYFSLFLDKSESQKKHYSTEIKNLFSNLTKFIEMSLEKNDILLYPFVQSIIYKSYYAAGNLFLNEGDYSKVQEIITNAKSIHSTFDHKFQTQIETYGFIIKLNGDLLFYKKEYENALNEYMEAESLLKDTDDQEKAFVFTNMGITSIFLKNGKAANYLNKALTRFNKLKKEGKNSFGKWETLQILYDNKINKIQEILNKFNC